MSQANKETIIQLLLREIEQEVDFEKEFDNDNYLKELISAYEYFNRKHYSSFEFIVNNELLKEVLKRREL